MSEIVTKDELAAYRGGLESGVMVSATPNVVKQLLNEIDRLQRQKHIDSALQKLPDQKEIRLRIAENLQERQTLRQLLKLADQRTKAQTISEEGRRGD